MCAAGEEEEHGWGCVCAVALEVGAGGVVIGGGRSNSVGGATVDGCGMSGAVRATRVRLERAAV